MMHVSVHRSTGMQKRFSKTEGALLRTGGCLRYEESRLTQSTRHVVSCGCVFGRSMEKKRFLQELSVLCWSRASPQAFAGCSVPDRQCSIHIFTSV